MLADGDEEESRHDDEAQLSPPLSARSLPGSGARRQVAFARGTLGSSGSSELRDPIPQRISASERSRPVVGVLGDVNSSIRRIHDGIGRQRLLGVLSLPVTAHEETQAREAEAEAELLVLQQTADALDAFSDGGSSVGADDSEGRFGAAATTSPGVSSPMRMSPGSSGPGSAFSSAARRRLDGALAGPVTGRRGERAVAGAAGAEATPVRDETGAIFPGSGQRARTIRFAPLWGSGDTPRRVEAARGAHRDAKTESRNTECLTWQAIAEIRGMQIEVLLRLHDASQLVRPAAVCLAGMLMVLQSSPA
jgi:hypothetical protein